MLTLVLPLKGREAFTKRFLDHTAKGDYRVLIADGSDEPQNWTAKYPHVNYHYYEPDRSLADYWAKMTHVLENYAHSEYAMICDNDDFPIQEGLRRCVQFLEHNDNFVACSGRIRGVWLFPDKLIGPHCHTTRQYAPYDTPALYDQHSPKERILKGFQNSWSYFAVYRTPILRQIWKDIAFLDLKDLQVHEKFCAIRALSLGKIHCFSHFCSYLRQYETSIRNTDIVADWAMRMTKNEWGGDVIKVLDFIKTDGLREKWADWYANYLNRHFGWRGVLRRKAKAHFPRLAYAYQHWHEYLQVKNNLAEVFND